MTAFVPRNPDFEATVRASFAQQGLLVALGARLSEVAPGRVTIELDFAPHLTQQQGLFHGGAIGMIGDTAAGYACLTLLEAGSEVVSVEYKINFARPARGERLVARGEVMRSGKSLSVARAEIDVINGHTRETCAYVQATMFRVDA